MSDVELGEGLLAAPEIEPEPDREELQRIFDMYDVAPQDGQLDYHEFKLAMIALNDGQEISERFVRAAFDDTDTNHDGTVDFEEFFAGYNNLVDMSNNKAARRAEALISGATQLDTLGGMVRTFSPPVMNSRSSRLVLKPPTIAETFREETNEILGYCAPVFQVLGCLLGCALFILFSGILIGMGALSTPFLFYYYAGFKESCSQPLAEWCTMMGDARVITLVNLFLTWAWLGWQSLNQPADRRFANLEQPTPPWFLVLSGQAINIYTFYVMYIGFLYMYDAGALLFMTSKPGYDCAEDAPEVFWFVQTFMYLVTFQMGFVAVVSVMACVSLGLYAARQGGL